jgi:hypothetical protein
LALEDFFVFYEDFFGNLKKVGGRGVIVGVNRWLFKSFAGLHITYVLLPQMFCAMLKPIGCSDNKTASARKYFSDYALAPKAYDYFSRGVRLKRGSPTIN